MYCIYMLKSVAQEVGSVATFRVWNVQSEELALVV